MQFVPLFAVIAGLFHLPDWRGGGVAAGWFWLNVGLVAIRILLQFGLAGSYAHRQWTFWLSFTADPVAAIRIVLSSLRRPSQWRTRRYEHDTVVPV